MIPFFSIIIPVYNSEKYIDVCINSILNQSLGDFEVLIIDDGSTDESSSIIEQYSLQDNRIKLYLQQNSGPGIARNLGIKYAVGEYVLFLDSDDYLQIDALERLFNWVKCNNCDFLFYGFVQESEDGKELSRTCFTEFSNYPKKELIKLMTIGKLPFGAFHLIKNSIIKDNNCLYSNKVKQNEELIFKLNLLLHSKVIDFIDYTPYHYIKHPVSLSKSVINNPFKNDKLVIDEISEILKRVITNQQEYLQVINTYCFNKLVIWGYSECRNSKDSFIKTYKHICNVFREKKSNVDIKNIDLTLLPLKVKFLSTFVIYNMYLTFTAFSFLYKIYDKHRII